MKKIYVSFAALVITTSVIAQNKNEVANQFNSYNGTIIESNNSSNKAAGDTLFWLPAPIYYVNPTDASGFTITTEDVDGLTLNSVLTSNGFTATSFGLFYSLQPSDIFPSQGDVDTGFFWGATSWFTSPAQASNWLIFGPLTIPAGGADISWMHRMQDANFRDGYKVLVNNVGDSYLDFSDPAIFTVADNAPTTTGDTVWTNKSVTLPATYSGQQVYFAFHHDANDMFILWLDDIRVTEGNNPTASLEENSYITLLSAYPNPFRVTTNIAFELKNTSEVILQMFDLSGKMVMQRNVGIMSSGLNRIEVDGTSLPSGVYYYTLTINGETTSAHKLVKM